MVRKARRDQDEIEAALCVAATARTLAQLRQSQAILIPALTGASLDLTARMLGLSRSRVCLLRRQFRAGGTAVDSAAQRGGRRRALMSIEEEARFLEPWLAQARGAREPVVAAIHAAYERAVGRRVPKSTIYRLLARHGWRRGLTAPVAL